MRSLILGSLVLISSLCLPATARAADAYSPAWMIYAINQVCQAWSDGVNRCFPVAMVGPAPGRVATGLEPITAPPAAVVTQPTAAPAEVPTETPPVIVASIAPEPVPVPTPPPVAPVAAPEPLAGTGIAVDDGLAHFDFDSAELTDAGRAAVDAWLLMAPPNLAVRVTGHADRLGSSAYNQSLSNRRAESVRRYLIDKGMRAEDVQIDAKGESAPIAHCKGGPTPSTIACLAPNRRAEINPFLATNLATK